MNQLAIIIPAFKDTFLGRALNSLASQTCKDFIVYVGDDASPYNIKSIVAEYSDKINIAYHRFENNLGGKDLVGQWERSISLSQGEPWIWLFSDDDEMEPKCIELFYAEIEKNKYDLYHLNVDVIDSNSQVIKKANPFFSMLTVEGFVLQKLRGRLSSFVVEYVFSREIYERTGGFQHFDLAWNSDDATWIKMGMRKGIKTIDGAKVRWRSSSENISPNNSNPIIVKRKLDADIEYIAWLYSIWQHNKRMKWKLYIPMATWMAVNLLKAKKTIPTIGIYNYCKSAGTAMTSKFMVFFIILYYWYRNLTEK